MLTKLNIYFGRANAGVPVSKITLFLDVKKGTSIYVRLASEFLR